MPNWKKPLPALLLALVAAANAHAARRAVLVGINDYSASRLGAPRAAPPYERDWFDLSGAANDAQAMREMLVARYGFGERDVVTLTDQDATREAILRAIDTHLVQPASRGDVVVFYFAGHGSQVHNSLSDEADRLDESIVPADSRLGARDIRDKELRPLFAAIAAAGARLTIILDNCHSGSGARGLPTGARPRSVKPDPRDLADRTPFPAPAEERGALVLTATPAAGQAWETRDADGVVHGAFSWALLRAMRDAASDESASETFARTAARLRAETPYQEPAIAGTTEARNTPLLSTRRADVPSAPIAVERVLTDGTVVLHGGWANGLSVGSELRAGETRLRVTALRGLMRAHARVETGRVKPGALLEVTSWGTPPGRPLRVWIPRTSQPILPLARTMHAAAMAHRIRWITAPLERTPTHVLRRGNDGWELLASGVVQRSGVDPLACVRALPAGSSLFVQFPAPAAMLDGIDEAQRIEDADYILAGRYAARTLQYAWLRPAVVASDRRKTELPLRTDWMQPDGLRDALARLRRIHAWTQLEPPPGERSPYRLALRRLSDGEEANGPLIGEERYQVVLRAASRSETRPRFVYLFAIDSYGRSTLLFPRNGSVENQMPLAPPQLTLEITPPYGVDTYVLLTTDESLPDPWILEWNGVRTRAPIGTLAMPSSWSLERVVFESVPPAATKCGRECR